MNKFLQVLLGLTAFVWLVIGLVLITSIVLLVVWNPIAHLGKFSQEVPKMLPSILQGASGGVLPSMLNNVSPQQLACAKQAIGTSRFNALTSGQAQFGASDITKVMPCLGK